MAKFFNKFLPVFIFPVFILTAAVSPFSCSLSSDGGIFRSTDYASTWQQKVKISGNQTIGGKTVLALAIDEVNPDTLYLGSRGSGLYRSQNRAETWQAMIDNQNILDKRADVYDIKISSQNHNLIYLAVYQNNFGRILQSQDAGAHWQEIYITAVQGIAVNTIETDQSNQAILYVGTSDGELLKSADRGLSWKLLKWFQDPILEIKIAPQNDNIIYVAMPNKGLFESPDQGLNWQSLNLNRSGKIEQLAIDVANPKILFVVSQASILVSYDGGSTWQPLNILTPQGSAVITALAQDSKNSNILYYAAGSIIYKTQNLGQTWTVQQIPSSRSINLIRIDPFDSNIVYAGMGS